MLRTVNEICWKIMNDIQTRAYKVFNQMCYLYLERKKNKFYEI